MNGVFCRELALGFKSSCSGSDESISPEKPASGTNSPPGAEVQRPAQIVAAKSGADADHHVIPGDEMEAHEPAKKPALDLMESKAGGFRSQNHTRGGRKPFPKLGELFVLKMMQEEIGHDDLGIGQGVGEEIALMPSRLARPIGRAAGQVEGADLFGAAQTAANQLLAQGTIARAELQDAPSGADVAADLARDPAVIAHDAIDEQQVLSALNGTGFVFGQSLQHLGFDEAIHELGDGRPKRCQGTRSVVLWGIVNMAK